MLEGNPKNLRELYDGMREVGTADGMSRIEIHEWMDALQARLKEKGFDGMSHRGGLNTETPQHQVRIHFHPADDIELVPAELDVFRPADVSQGEQTQLAEVTHSEDMFLGLKQCARGASMADFAECLRNMTDGDIITRDEAKELGATFERIRAQKAASMGEDAAGAAAQVELLKRLEAEAKHKKRKVLLTIAAQRRLKQQLADFRDPSGAPDIGLASINLLQHYGRAGYSSVAGRFKSIVGMAQAEMEELLHEFRRKAFSARGRTGRASTMRCASCSVRRAAIRWRRASPTHGRAFRTACASASTPPAAPSRSWRTGGFRRATTGAR